MSISYQGGRHRGPIVYFGPFGGWEGRSRYGEVVGDDYLCGRRGYGMYLGMFEIRTKAPAHPTSWDAGIDRIGAVHVFPGYDFVPRGSK